MMINAFDKYAAKQHLTAELVKTARLKLDDVEDHLGIMLDRRHHKDVEQKLQERRSKSFSLRHPILTGLPTLGLAPAVARAKALEHVKRHLLRKDHGIRKAHQKALDRKRQMEMEDERLSIDRARAEAPVRAVGAAAAGAAPLLAAFLQHKKENPSRGRETHNYHHIR